MAQIKLRDVKEWRVHGQKVLLTYFHMYLKQVISSVRESNSEPGSKILKEWEWVTLLGIYRWLEEDLGSGW